MNLFGAMLVNDNISVDEPSAVGMAQQSRHEIRIIVGLCNFSLLCLLGCSPSQDFAVPFEPGVVGIAAIPDPLVIQLTGTEHRWRAAYPVIGGAAAVVQDLRAGGRLPLPLDTDVVLVLNSEDFIYTLTIPELGLKEIAVPGLQFRLAFRPTSSSPYSLVGDELCGLPQSGNSVQLVAEPREQFLKRFAGDHARL